MAERVTDRETLLAAADALVHDGGESRLTIRALAGACHISPSTVYNYFASREDLIAELCHRYLEDLHRHGTGTDRRSVWASFLAWASRQQHRAGLVMSQMADPGNDRWTGMYERAFPGSDPVADPDEAQFVLAVSRLVLPGASNTDVAVMRDRLDDWLGRINRWSAAIT